MSEQSLAEQMVDAFNDSSPESFDRFCELQRQTWDVSQEERDEIYTKLSQQPGWHVTDGGAIG